MLFFDGYPSIIELITPMLLGWQSILRGILEEISEGETVYGFSYHLSNVAGQSCPYFGHRARWNQSSQLPNLVHRQNPNVNCTYKLMINVLHGESRTKSAVSSRGELHRKSITDPVRHSEMSQSLGCLFATLAPAKTYLLLLHKMDRLSLIILQKHKRSEEEWCSIWGLYVFKAC